MCWVMKLGLMSLKLFGSYVAWPRDKYYFSEGANPVEETRPSTVVDEDFNTKMNELLRRDDWAQNMVLFFLFISFQPV